MRPYRDHDNYDLERDERAFGGDIYDPSDFPDLFRLHPAGKDARVTPMAQPLAGSPLTGAPEPTSLGRAALPGARR